MNPLAWILTLACCGTEPPALTAVHGVALTVRDLEPALAFYTGVLPFTLEERFPLHGAAAARLLGVENAQVEAARLRLGEETLYLMDFVTPESRPFPMDAEPNDRVFQHAALVVRDMARAHARLLAHGVRPASMDPQRLPESNAAAAGIEAFYFRDPDGHWLELIRFPPGKGDPRWQRPGEGLFLGIDHTAIVVEDTEESLAFYRDRLGLAVAGESENHGVEQERLNGVFGCYVRITALRGGAGPGIELLDYLAPAEGRPMPDGYRASDTAHWWVVAQAADAGCVLAAARAHRPRLVSPGVMPLCLPGGMARGLALRDPDGHGLLAIEGRIDP